MAELAFFRADIPFFAYGLSHLIVLLIGVFLLAAIFIANKKLSYQQNLLIGRYFSIFLAITVVIYTLFEIALGRFPCRPRPATINLQSFLHSVTLAILASKVKLFCGCLFFGYGGHFTGGDYARFV